MKRGMIEEVDGVRISIKSLCMNGVSKSLEVECFKFVKNAHY